MIFIQCMRDIGCVVTFYIAVVTPFPVAYIKAFPFVVCIKCFAHNNVRAAGRFVIKMQGDSNQNNMKVCGAPTAPGRNSITHLPVSDNTKGTAVRCPNVMRNNDVKHLSLPFSD